MTRDHQRRFTDILDAIEVIRSHLKRGDLSDGLVFDAVRVRLIEIGEAIKAIPDDVLAGEPEIPWCEVSGMRDRLAHRYFDTSHAIVSASVADDLPVLEAAILRLQAR
ncbi:MAG TPA: HepT-like ribonuclease domain-containing protein [Acidimicrobiales bacterium]|nr:HepT-like ribonuclease domain-containing protein [Acidimicrobiales bacterium]